MFRHCLINVPTTMCVTHVQQFQFVPLCEKSRKTPLQRGNNLPSTIFLSKKWPVLCKRSTRKSEVFAKSKFLVLGVVHPFETTKKRHAGMACCRLSVYTLRRTRLGHLAIYREIQTKIIYRKHHASKFLM